MTDKELKAKILAEIERLRNELNFEPFTDEVLGKRNVLDKMSKFIDPLPEEPVSEDLNEAADNYYKEVECYPPTLPQYCTHIKDAVKYGAKWQKEQMMSKAIDALVHTFDNGYIRVGTQLLANNKYGLKVGDKVKVIIVKED